VLQSLRVDDADQYSNFENLSYYEMVFNSTLAIMVFFAWIKVGSPYQQQQQPSWDSIEPTA